MQSSFEVNKFFQIFNKMYFRKSYAQLTRNRPMLKSSARNIFTGVA